MKRKIATLIVFLILSIGSHAQETMTVVTDGMGKNIESATQRAAEAALTQVVGSFIDSTKMIEKRKEIRNGVKKQTKKISSKISEYSQGMIQSIEVLEVSDDDGFTRVTAKVSVRIEDFKNYIKQTVLAEKKVRKGLLSKIKIKKKQSKNIAELVVGKVLKDIVSTEVMIPEINGEIEEVTKVKYIEFMDKKAPGDGYVIYIPVKTTINPDFLENAVNILDETAEKKIVGVPSKDAYKEIDYKYSITFGDFSNAYKGGGDYDIVNPIGNYGWTYSHLLNKGIMKYHILNPEDMLTYIFPQRSAKKLCKATELLGRGNARYGVSHVPDIKMSFLSESGKVLRKEVIKHKTSMGGTEMQTSRFSYVLGSSEPASSSMLQVTLEGTSDGVKCMVLVDTNSEYRILTKVSEDILTKTDKVVISYSHSKEHAGFDEFNK